MDLRWSGSHRGLPINPLNDRQSKKAFAADLARQAPADETETSRFSVTNLELKVWSPLGVYIYVWLSLSINIYVAPGECLDA